MKYVSGIVKKVMTNRGLVLAFVAALFLVYYLASYLNSNFTNTAKLSRDTWSYQSIGVNFAKGHGFHIAGKIGEIEDYKFDSDFNQRYLNKFNTFAGFTDLHRNLGYPLFLSIVYKIFGVHPLIVKLIQLGFLVLIAAALPILGHRYAGGYGFLGGLIAGPIYLWRNQEIAGNILGESLVCFMVLLIVFGCIEYERRRTLKAAIVLGLIFGASILVKGSLMLIPPLYLAYRWYKHRDEMNFIRMAGFVMVLIILPWTLYINVVNSRIKGELIGLREMIFDNSLSIDEKVELVSIRHSSFYKGMLPQRNFTEKEIGMMKDSIFPLVRLNGFILKDTILTDVNKMCLLEQAISSPSL